MPMVQIREEMHDMVKSEMIAMRMREQLMADVKVMDEEKHRAFTGSGNREILKNIQAADELGVPMIMHTQAKMQTTGMQSMMHTMIPLLT